MNNDPLFAISAPTAEDRPNDVRNDEPTLATPQVISTSAAITPPLKWAGGKRWLVQSEPNLFPTSYGKYFEPFAGSAAVFFHLAPSRAVLSDLNTELIDTYVALRDCWEKVVGHLITHQRRHSTAHYYEVRSSKPRTLASRAAKFIYLNRTCFNGLYRVNRLGEFNVPKGSKDSVILETDDFTRVAGLLKNTELIVSDFETVIESANGGDLVFVDPPYTVMHSLNGFVKYNEVLFSWKDQVRLADCLIRASRRNVILISTNADHPSVMNLYKDLFHIQRLQRNSLISGKSIYRKTVGELLITSL